MGKKVSCLWFLLLCEFSQEGFHEEGRVSLARMLPCEEKNDGLAVFLVSLFLAFVHCLLNSLTFSFTDNEVRDLIVAQSVGNSSLLPLKPVFFPKRLHFS